MKLHLFILLFFTGVFSFVQSVSRKFYLILEEKKWSDAQVYCRAMYTDLATIEYQHETAQLQNLAKGQNLAVSAWIGLYDDVNSWRWSLENEPLGSYRKWYAPNPDNYLSIEHCGVINAKTWTDNPCTQSYPFVCFDGTYTGTNRYIYISTRRTWPQAQSYCRQHHTDLVSVRNDSETSTIMSMISGHTWTGLYRDNWKWSDQTNFTTITWASGQPDNSLKNENCVSFKNGQAGDEKCLTIKPFFCYAVITGQKQIVKVKVRSNQDVNAPAFKAAILDHIKQLLVDYKNITVKWRDQPNGLVFNKIQRNTVAV